MALAGDGGRWHGVGKRRLFFFLARDDANVWVKRTKVAIARARGRVHYAIHGPPTAQGHQGHPSAKQTILQWGVEQQQSKRHNSRSRSVSRMHAHGLESSAIRTHCNLAGHDLSIMASKTQPLPFSPLQPRFSRHKPTPHAIPNVCCPPPTPRVERRHTFFGPLVPE